MQEGYSGDDALHRTTPKTARSRAERPQQATLDREAAGERHVGSDSVFTNTLGAPILADNLYRILKRLCARAEVPYLGTHVARHTFASLLGASGVSIEVVSAVLGHAKLSFTLEFTQLGLLPGEEEEED